MDSLNAYITSVLMALIAGFGSGLYAATQQINAAVCAEEAKTQNLHWCVLNGTKYEMKWKVHQ